MAAPQQSGNPGDHSYTVLWYTIAVFAACAGIWYSLKDSIIRIYLYIKLYQLDFISFFYSGNMPAVKTKILAALANTQSLTFMDMKGLGDLASAYIRYPYAFILFVLAVVVYFGNNTRVFRQLYSMKDLAGKEVINWPQISSPLTVDLTKADIDKGPWAMALTPMQFCKRHQLLEEYRSQSKEGLSRKEWGRVEVTLKRGQANKVFAIQLGMLWPGIDRVPLHVRALFAIFAARLNADTEAAYTITRRLNLSSTKKLDFTGVDQLINKHYNTKLVQEIVNSHAYLLTVMSSMLVGAREDGVQSTADFLWLKPIDRRLWYTLNAMGRQTPFVESAGVFAHWVAEKEAGKKLLVPMVEEATKALEFALKEVIYHPDENTDVQTS
jgi:intracellular multiplication protein IcmP